jgi:SAM-dependent methyltransferase
MTEPGEVGDDLISWTVHWRDQQPPDRQDFNDPHAFDYVKPYLLEKFKVLEVGCGAGFWCTNWELIGGEYYGIDANREAIALARKRHPRNVFWRMPVQSMSFDQLFDVVFSHTVLQHTNLETKRFALGGIWEALKKGGLFVLEENCEVDSQTTMLPKKWEELVLRYRFKLVLDDHNRDNTRMVFRR